MFSVQKASEVTDFLFYLWSKGSSSYQFSPYVRQWYRTHTHFVTRHYYSSSSSFFFFFRSVQVHHSFVEEFDVKDGLCYVGLFDFMRIMHKKKVNEYNF